MAGDLGDYEMVIGLEVHAQLLTETKAFCGCKTSFGDPPNTHTCPVCLGLPGALPVLNERAVTMAVQAALALGCNIEAKSIFARKNYFYPDLPKGYQISQYELPFATWGALDVELPDGPSRTVRIRRIHMEEDAGKNLHGVGADSIVDLNRAGTCLIEIVSEPDLRSGAEAAEYLRRLREVLMFLGVNDGNLEQGSFRCDANVSVNKIGAKEYGTRTELKNINSFKFVADAIEIEARRQVAALERGEKIRQQTRGYNAEKRESFAMRDKEGDAGYRYFPEPDLPPLVLDEAFVLKAKQSLRETPAQMRQRLVDTVGITPYSAGVLVSHPEIARFFQETLRFHKDAQRIANFIQSEVLRDVQTTGLTATFPVSPAQVGGLLNLIEAGTISGKQGKEVYAGLLGNKDKKPEDVVKEKGLVLVSDAGALEAMAKDLIAKNPKQAEGYKAGKATLLGFFVGQIMKQTQGNANPAVVNDVLVRLLGSPADVSPPAAGTPSTTPGAPQASTALAAGARDTQPSLTGAMLAAAKPVDRPASEPAAPASDAPQLVTYEHFAQLDIRVGLIVSGERVPKKDKLLDLRIDVGDAAGPRQIVAGLALSFAPEDLVGKKVMVICNLEPRVFSKGLTSHGMILAAGPSEQLSLSTVTRDVPAGTRVK